MWILLILILANGIFAMAEIAMISARPTRLKSAAEAGHQGAAAALHLKENSADFLSTIQIGITLIGILLGAFSSTTVAAQFAPYLQNLPLVGPYANQIAAFTAVALITYLSLVLGELIPKQIAANYAEDIASRVARPMLLLARIARPLVLLLSFSTRWGLAALRLQPTTEPLVTAEEINQILEQGTESGIVEPIEEQIVSKLFRVGDLHVNDLMTDRLDVTWLDPADSPETLSYKLSLHAHSRYPVARGHLDNLLGLVQVKDVLMQLLTDEPLDLEAALQPPEFIPSGVGVYQVLEKMKKRRTKILFVTDEHGGVAGLVTFNDLLEAVVGDVPEEGDGVDPTAVQREDGSWLIDGRLATTSFKEMFDIRELPQEEQNYYQTVGGFVMNYLGRLPEAGDYFEWNGYRMEVMDMDWRRVDKVLFTLLPPPQESNELQKGMPDESA